MYPPVSLNQYTYLYLPLFTYIWLYLGLITLIWAYLPLIALILPYVPYSPYMAYIHSSIETAPLSNQTIIHGDIAFQRFGGYNYHQRMQFGC